MKRQSLVARVAFLVEKQHQLEDAARELVKAEQANPVNRCGLNHARREHQERAIAFGLACKRYLGGRE